MRNLAGSTALITGGSRGLGPFIAEALAREGMRLILVARSAPQLEAVAARLRQGGAQALALPVDLLDRGALEQLARTADEQHGPLDVLVNNAGAEGFLPYAELSADEIEQVVRINLLAPMLLTRLVLPGMLQRRRGHIVNIASLAGKGMPGYAETYVATKAGMIGFSASLRASYRSLGVSASVISPGFVRAAGMYHQGEQAAGRYAPRILGTTTPEAVAQAVVRAIKADLPDLIVNPTPARAFFALRELAPRAAEWLAQRLGLLSVFKQLAQVRLQERDRDGTPRS